MAMTITETFYPKTAALWRRWLTRNHDKKKEIWVIFYKKHTGKQTLSLQHAIDEALCFGWIDSIEKGIDKRRFALRFTPRRNKSAWSPTNITRYKSLLAQGLITNAGKEAFQQSDL